MKKHFLLIALVSLLAAAGSRARGKRTSKPLDCGWFVLLGSAISWTASSSARCAWRAKGIRQARAAQSLAPLVVIPSRTIFLQRILREGGITRMEARQP
jgi:hypothetical protein